MTTFATEVSFDIRSASGFWSDLAHLRAAGVRATLPLVEMRQRAPTPDAVDVGALARLLTSASVLAQAADEESRDLAQQIAVFSSLTSDDHSVWEAAVDILSGLGNFPGLGRLSDGRSDRVSIRAFLRRGLLQTLNSVSIAGKELALTSFQLDVWRRLQGPHSMAVSAPTSAGKSFLVLEHLCLLATKRKRFVAIYVAPTRALLSEIQVKLEHRLLTEDSQLRVTTVPLADPQERPKQIYVVTQERLQLLLATVDLRNCVDLVVVDEAQAIGDSGRGIILHDALEKLKASSPRTRFLLLAPGAEGFGQFGRIFGLDDLVVEDSTISPVVQNRINVEVGTGGENVLKLSLVTPRASEPIGTCVFGRGFALPSEDARLAAVALALGETGGSLVYATGPGNAESLARLLSLSRADVPSQSRDELAGFIEKHVHKKYSLAAFVRRGVAFHYGNLPSLLREGIESAFKLGQIDYLCCTTTLFQGVNLPARNVFIDTPTRGNRGEPLDEAALWNFAGRAGRLGKEVVGNVFLVNYDNWPSKPFAQRRSFKLNVAFKDALNTEFEQTLQVLEQTSNPFSTRSKEPQSERAVAAAGLSLLRASQGTLHSLLDQASLELDVTQVQTLTSAANKAALRLGLPAQVLATSWVVDPRRLSSLLSRLREGARKKEFGKLIPTDPSGDSYKTYNSIIRRMFKHLGGLELAGEENAGNRKYVNHVTAIAVKWMRGDPLSQLVQEAVRYRVKTVPQTRRRDEQAIVDRAIREMFTLVEKEIRFRLVQWSKAYCDLLTFVLTETGHDEVLESVYDFSLALELGVSSRTGRSLVELGLSRITATSITALATNSSMTTQEIRAWLRAQPEALLKLSPVILDELRAKSLWNEVAP